jgi:hypothetical protein
MTSHSRPIRGFAPAVRLRCRSSGSCVSRRAGYLSVHGSGIEPASLSAARGALAVSVDRVDRVRRIRMVGPVLAGHGRRGLFPRARGARLLRATPVSRLRYVLHPGHLPSLRGCLPPVRHQCAPHPSHHGGHTRARRRLAGAAHAALCALAVRRVAHADRVRARPLADRARATSRLAGARRQLAHDGLSRASSGQVAQEMAGGRGRSGGGCLRVQAERGRIHGARCRGVSRIPSSGGNRVGRRGVLDRAGRGR